jgi:hypothetical protein
MTTTSCAVYRPPEADRVASMTMVYEPDQDVTGVS